MDAAVTAGAPSCASCGSVVTDADRFCEACGARLASSGHDTRAHWELDLGAVAGVTDRGRMHVRNEDALFVGAGDGGAVAVVSDGISTSQDPHRASQLAADTAGRHLTRALHERAGARCWDPRSQTANAVAVAQRAVADLQSSEQTGTLPSACTLVTAVWDGSQITVGWIGDSRAYWIADGESACLTVDDSWLQDQLDTGAMTQRTAMADPRAHQITRWLGADASQTSARVASHVPARQGHVIVCSDGFWNYAATPERLSAEVSAVPSPAPAIAIARALTRAALAAGGHDNITVGVITVLARDVGVDRRTL